MSRRLTTIPRAAKEIGVAAQTLYNHISDGRIPVYKRPGQRGGLVDLDEVAAYFAARRPAAPRTDYGSYGPDAIVRTLTDEDLKDAEVTR